MTSRTRWTNVAIAVSRHENGALRLAATLAADDTLTSPLLPGFAAPFAGATSFWRDFR